METISQRELRNQSSRVLRDVAEGKSYCISNHGVPIARLEPIHTRTLLDLTLREGSGVMEFEPGIKISESTDSVLAELRKDR